MTIGGGGDDCKYEGRWGGGVSIIIPPPERHFDHESARVSPRVSAFSTPTLLAQNGLLRIETAQSDCELIICRLSRGAVKDGRLKA